MGRRGGATLTGVKERRAAVDRFPDAVTAEFRGVARQSANRAVMTAQRLVPKDTMQTHDSIRVTEDVEHKRLMVEAGYPGSARSLMVPVWLEYGTVFMEARAYMRPAREQEDERYQQQMRQASERLPGKVFR